MYDQLLWYLPFMHSIDVFVTIKQMKLIQYLILKEGNGDELDIIILQNMMPNDKQKK